MRAIVEYAYTASNGVRFRIGDDQGLEQWRCLECWEFGHAGHQGDVRDAEFQAQKCANEHALECKLRNGSPTIAQKIVTAYAPQTNSSWQR